jgi:hypothetical protein
MNRLFGVLIILAFELVIVADLWIEYPIFGFLRRF